MHTGCHVKKYTCPVLCKCSLHLQAAQAPCEEQGGGSVVLLSFPILLPQTLHLDFSQNRNTNCHHTCYRWGPILWPQRGIGSSCKKKDSQEVISKTSFLWLLQVLQGIQLTTVPLQSSMGGQTKGSSLRQAQESHPGLPQKCPAAQNHKGQDAGSN